MKSWGVFFYLASVNEAILHLIFRIYQTLLNFVPFASLKSFQMFALCGENIWDATSIAPF